MTHVAWRQSGLPPTQVIGAGCNLDSEQLSHVLNINLNTHKPAWVIGELSDNKGETEKLKTYRLFFDFSSSASFPSKCCFCIAQCSFVIFVLGSITRTINPLIICILPTLEFVNCHSFSVIFVLQFLWWVTLGWTLAFRQRLHQDPTSLNRC